MTEAAHQMTSNVPHDRVPGSVGFGQGGVEIRIYTEAPENRRLGVGEEGEVCVRGRNVTKGYLNNPKANSGAFIFENDQDSLNQPIIPPPEKKKATANAGLPFFRTGDRGVLGPNGRLTLVGRISEIINRGGEKISPLEIDSCILAISPAFREAVSFAVPDTLLGQEVEAAVVLDMKHEDVRRLGLDNEVRIQEIVMRSLAEFKVPKKIHFCEGAIPKGQPVV